MTVSSTSAATKQNRLFDLATADDEARLCRDISDAQCREQPRNFLIQTGALALSKCGDALADTKTVLPWLLGAVGAPVYLIGLLTPIRESLALVPQLLVGGVIRRFAVRKWFWSGASVIEGLCVLAMAAVAAFGLEGAVAGWGIVGLLAVFSTARGVASVAAKDTMGKTVSKGKRGRVNGHAAAVAGFVTATVGLYLALSPEQTRPEWVLYSIVAAAGICWLIGAATFSTTLEYAGATDGGRSLWDTARHQITLILSDRNLQRFLLARGLLVSTALASPVYVALALQQDEMNLTWLGWLVVASGAATATSASFWGVFSDRSSRGTMALSASMASIIGMATTVTIFISPETLSAVWFYIVIFYILGIAHAGARIGRKTQLVDMAGKDEKAEYTALSNTITGILLIVFGVMVSALMTINLTATVMVLSVLSALGAAVSLSLKNAQAS